MRGGRNGRDSKRKNKVPPAEVGSAGGECGAFAWVAPPWWNWKDRTGRSSWLPVAHVRRCDPGIGLCELHARPNGARRIHPLANLLETCRCRRAFAFGHRPTASPVLSLNCLGVSEQGSPQRKPLQHPSGRIAPEFGFRSSRRRAASAVRRRDAATRSATSCGVRSSGAARWLRCHQSPVRTRLVRRGRRAQASVGGACAHQSLMWGCIVPACGPSAGSHKSREPNSEAHRTPQRRTRVIEPSAAATWIQLHPMLLPQFRQR